MTQNKKLLAALGAVAVLMALMVGLYAATRPDTHAGEKTITVTVVHRDESEKTFTYQTDGAYLGEVLESEGFLKGEEGPYGIFIAEVDGERAVFEEDGCYWALYRGEEYATQGADQTPIADGDVFSFVYTVG